MCIKPSDRFMVSTNSYLKNSLQILFHATHSRLKKPRITAITTNRRKILEGLPDTASTFAIDIATTASTTSTLYISFNNHVTCKKKNIPG